MGDDEPEDMGWLPEPPQTTYYNETYMFESVNGMGHASVYDYNISVNNTIIVTWDIQCRFEEPIVGETGYVNITLESDGVVLMSEEYTSLETAFFHLDYNNSNITGENFNLRIQSVGSDHTLTGGVEDYYIVETVINYW
tara:strand:+ start:8209 stop:8625 length:417 start_codon:yes stop_codon:yes gene_type:complete